MPNRHKPRRNKKARMLVQQENVIRVPQSVFSADRGNDVPRMDETAKREVTSIIEARYDSARQTTEEIAAKMEKWDRQYDGVWQDPTVDDEKIFLPKTREEFQVIYAHILHLVSQLDPLVTAMPMVTSLYAADEEYKRAKVKEALLDFQMDDVWKFRDDVFPRWLKTFLKHSIGVWKVTYREDAFLPDLKVEVIDRALLYIDPDAKTLRDARWVIEEYYLPRSEVMQRIEEGHWYIPDADIPHVIESGFHTIPDTVRSRYYGEKSVEDVSVQEDDLIRIWDYWQAPIKGLDSVYAVMIGGLGGDLARYGENPFPYKGLPYRGKSFDPHEYRVDGRGFVEGYTAYQEATNNLFNLRMTDVRKNIIRPVAATGRLIDAQTQQDFKDGQKIVRLSDAAMEASRDPAFDVRKHFVELPVGTSTQELLTADLPFILSQAQNGAHTPDIMAGRGFPDRAPLGGIQEQLTKAAGVFRPIYLQVCRGIEEIAEIAGEYYNSPEFFPTERIIQIVGRNRYSDVIQDWHNPGGNLFVRAVSPDEMDVDVTLDVVHQADALATRTFMVTALEQIFQGIGQIPDLMQELRGELNFARIVEIMLTAPGLDSEAIRLTDQQKQERAQRDQQAEAKQMQMAGAMGRMQAQLAGLAEDEKQAARARSQMAIDTNKADLQADQSRKDIRLEGATRIDEIVTKFAHELATKLTLMEREAQLERQNPHPVGHGNNVNQ